MATVTIDIPGIGTVEAENAASESTLRELVNLMKKGGGSGSGGSSGGSGGGGGGGGSSDKEEKLEKKSDILLNVAGKLTAGFGKVATASIDLVGKFANAGDSLESAAGVFSGIPIVGSMFGLVASSASKVADSFVAGAASGATFNGSIRSFSESASQAGMTLDKFGGFLADNGAAMAALGGETSSGAKRFSTLSRQLRDSGQDLFALGYSTETLNEGLANYARNQRVLGRVETMTNQDLVKGSKEYLKEMDLLAKVTGQSRKEKEAERQQMLLNIQWQAYLNKVGPDAAESAMKLVQTYPESMQPFIKDYVMTGTLTTEANQKMGFALGQTMNELNGARQAFNDGQAIENSRMDSIREASIRDRQSLLDTTGEAITANQAVAEGLQPIAELGQLQQDAMEKGAKSQDEATASQERLNESVQESRASIADMSNSFLMAISESGGLPQLIDAFRVVGNIVMEYILPAFTFLSDKLDLVIGAVVAYKSIMFLANLAIGANNLLMALFNTSLVAAVAGMWGLVAPVLAAAAPFLLVAAAVAGVILIFKAFGGDLDVLKAGLKIWWEGYKGYFNLLKLGFLKVLDFIPGLDFSEAIEETKEALAQNAQNVKDNADFIKDRMKENRENAKKEKEEKKKNEKEDKARFTVKKEETKSLETANKKLDKERQKNVDYNTSDAVSLLGQELKAQQSSLAGAEGKKKEVETERAQEKAKAEKAKEESKPDSTKTAEAKVETASGSSDQNSPRELLAALNTKMDALIRVAGAQLQVQRSLGNDLFAG